MGRRRLYRNYFVAVLVPTISCIVPTLDRGSVVCDTVQMLLAQTRPADEIILVDQTPVQTHAAERRLAAWASEGTITWLRQREPNASKARNTGALAASSEFLLFLDDDIRVGPDFLSAYADVLAREGTVGACGPILEERALMLARLPARAFTNELGWLLYFRKNYGRACKTSFMMSGNVAIRRDLFLALRGMDENYERGAHREESDFAMRFRQAGYRFQYDPRCAIYHLGPRIVPGGGARARSDGKDFRYFHHCVGDWYFNLKFCAPRTFIPLWRASVRHFVFNRQSLERPWRLPFALAYWLLALPPAALRRCRGARMLIHPGNSALVSPSDV